MKRVDGVLVPGEIAQCLIDRDSGGCFFFSSRRRHTRCSRDWSSDVCSSDLVQVVGQIMRRWHIINILPESSTKAVLECFEKRVLLLFERHYPGECFCFRAECE